MDKAKAEILLRYAESLHNLATRLVKEMSTGPIDYDLDLNTEAQATFSCISSDVDAISKLIEINGVELLK
ncbi:MAG: hypothetical protein WAV09_03160 [Minisyncoccia bacterium]